MTRSTHQVVALTAVVMLALVFFGVSSADGQTAQLKTLYTFTGGTDGGSSYAGVVRDAQGNLFGTTFAGGAANMGTVFKVDKAGNETVVHSFTGTPDGGHPTETLLLDPAGNFYGVTYYGGAFGFGSVFKLDKHGNVSVIYSFGPSPDGHYPGSALIQDELGNLYGTTGYGGATDHGTVFKVSKSGQEKVLHSFTRTDGQYPFSQLLLDPAGNLYGTTSMGGDFGNGTVFKLDRKGKVISVYSFAGGTDGANPYSGLVQDAAGNLYGTTYYGGAACRQYDCGTVYKIDSSFHETVLYAFTLSDGHYPDFGTLVLDAAGNLYGTTYAGGPAEMGVVFKINSTTGQQSTLYSFTGGIDDGFPVAGLTMDAAGNLYGATLGNGNIPVTYGTVFKIKP